MMDEGVKELIKICLDHISKLLHQMEVKSLSESDHVVHYVTDQIPHVLYHQFIESEFDMRNGRKIHHDSLKCNALTRCLSWHFRNPNQCHNDYFYFKIQDLEAISLMAERDCQRFQNLQRICL